MAIAVRSRNAATKYTIRKQDVAEYQGKIEEVSVSDKTGSVTMIRLEECPGISLVFAGKLQVWSKATPEVIAAGAWTRKHSKELAVISKDTKYRFYGFRFTESTPDVKCFHKILRVLGCRVQYAGREKSGDRNHLYRLKQS